MNLVADESVDRQIVERLREDGHAVWYIAEESPSITDQNVLKIAQEGSSVLLTSDKDFGELVYRLKQAMSGVMLIRLAGMSPDVKAECVSAVLREHGAEIVNSFTVVGRRTLRIRRAN